LRALSCWRKGKKERRFSPPFKREGKEGEGATIAIYFLQKGKRKGVPGAPPNRSIERRKKGKGMTNRPTPREDRKKKGKKKKKPQDLTKLLSPGDGAATVFTREGKGTRTGGGQAELYQ